MSRNVIKLLISLLVLNGICYAQNIELTETPRNFSIQSNPTLVEEQESIHNIPQKTIKPIMIPANIQVPFKVKNIYDSKTLTTNTKVDIIVASDVYYETYLIFRRGDSGYMYPSYVNKAGKFGNNGKIKFESAYITDLNGNEQLLNVNADIQGKKIIYGSWGFLSNSQNAEIGPGILFYGKTVNAFPFNN